MPAGDKLLVTLEDGIKTICFNQPAKKNAIDREMTMALKEVMEEAARDSSKVVVITGAGTDFCSGADLKSSGMTHPGDVGEFLRTYTNPTIQSLRTMPKPVIAKVRGVAAGVGCNYALAADLRIASPEARFGQIFARIGLMPDGGSTYFLPKMIGYARAFEWMVTAELYDAQRCRDMGLVNQVVPAGQLDSVVDELAHRLAQGPALAFAGIKRALNAGDAGHLSDALAAEAAGQEGCIRSADFREGVAAFLEKRPARFAGS